MRRLYTVWLARVVCGQIGKRNRAKLMYTTARAANHQPVAPLMLFGIRIIAEKIFALAYLEYCK